MPAIKHKDITYADGAHVVQRWVVDDAAALEALLVGPADVGGWARQLDTNEFHLLVDFETPTWLTMGGLPSIDISDVTGLQDALDDKADSSALTSGLAAKADKALTVNSYNVSNRNLDADDANALVLMTYGSANTVTVQPDSTVNLGSKPISVCSFGAGATTIVAGGGVTINKRSTATLELDGQFAVCTLVRTGSDTWLLTGELVAA